MRFAPYREDFCLFFDLVTGATPCLRRAYGIPFKALHYTQLNLQLLVS